MSASTSPGFPTTRPDLPAGGIGVPPCRHADAPPPGDAGSARWKLGRNCSLAPAQFLAVYGALAGVSLSVALFFWSLGARWVMPFACLELAAVGVAFWVHARHAGDAEWVTVRDRRLVLLRCHGGRWSREVLDAAWTAVGIATDGGALVQLRSGRRVVEVGRWVQLNRRRVFARELQAFLAARHPAAQPGCACGF